MQLNELFDNPAQKVTVDKEASDTFNFKIEDRKYSILIMHQKAYGASLTKYGSFYYEVSFLFRGSKEIKIDPIDYDSQVEATDFRKDAIKVLATVTSVVKKYFSNGLPEDSYILIEPNSDSKEKLYTVFAHKFAAMIGATVTKELGAIFIHRPLIQ